MKAPTILVVEDNPITRKMLRVALGAEGYSVLEAPDGRTALELVQKEPPDLILQDLLLPDMDGFELVGKLRKLPGGAEIPILACSGFLSRLEAAHAASSGFNDFIPKPVEPSRLLVVIQAYLPHSTANLEKPGQGRSLLMADDDPVQLKLTRLRLEELGFEVVTASDGAEALQLARKSAPDVIVSDVLMPHMDGFQFCLAVRQDRRLARVPVVLVSSNYIQESDRELASKLGASAYVFRTPDLDHLVRAVQKALREDSPPRARAPAEALDEEHGERVLQQLDRQVTMNAGLLQRLALQASMLSIMAGLSRALIRPGDVEEPLVELLDTVLDAGGVSLGALYLMDPHGRLRLRGQRGYAGPGNGDLESCLGHPEFIGQVLESESSLAIPSAQVPEKIGREFLDRAGGKSSVLAPIVGQANRLGVLLLASTQRDLTAREWGLFAQGIAFQIGQTITLSRAFAQLAASEQRYRGLFERNLAGVFLTTLDGRILDCNDACAHFFGHASREELMTHSICEHYCAAGDREALIARLKEEKRITNFEICFRKKDGSHVWALENAALLEGETGAPPVIEGTLIDITERKHSQKKLEERTAYLDALIENSPLAIVSHDAEGRVQFCNPAFERLFQYDPAEIIGRPVDQIIAAEESVSEAGEITRRVTGGDHVHRVTRRRRKDGTVVEVELYGVPLTVGRQLVGAYGIYQDITERKQLEEQLRQSQKMEAVGQLAGGVAHDFNNLLTVIRGYSDLLLEELPADGERQRRAATMIQESADRAASLTRQLLAFSRRQVLEPKVLEVNDVVLGMDKMLRRLIGEHIELRTVRKSGLGRVMVDPGQIEQVILNLAVNARDAMPDGGKLTIETANVELDETYAQRHVAVHPGRYVMLAVSDTGCGMDAATQARIFEPFFTTKAPGKGTGLGLSTVYGIVKQSGGNIWVYSEPGQGTTFKVYLPRVEEAPEARPAERPRPVAARGSETVLLVEDEAPLRTLIHQTLERHGYRLLEAQDATDALRIAEQHREPIDLLLSDVVMPQMGGRALAELVTPLHPETRVLYISGYTDDAIVHHGVLDPGVAFLQKPFSAADLTRKIREVLETHDVK